VTDTERAAGALAAAVVIATVLIALLLPLAPKVACYELVLWRDLVPNGEWGCVP
jgi:hypothetical protein